MTEGLENEQNHCESLHVYCVTSSQNILSAITCEGAKDNWDFQISDLVKNPDWTDINPRGEFR